MKSAYSILILFVVVLFSCGDDSGETETTLDSESISAFLKHHNTYRSEVGVADIKWSDDLAKSAQSWANELVDVCDLVHSNSPNGENLWGGTAGAFTIKDVVDSWGSEKANYNYADNSCSSVCGHYTQMVWENSTHVGCAMITCEGLDIWVCQYDPPGNFIGQKPY